MDIVPKMVAALKIVDLILYFCKKMIGVVILKIMQNVINHVLKSLYQYFWGSLLLTFILMVCYLFVYEKNESGQGIKRTLVLWFSYFRRSFDFRLLFFLVFYSSMICFRTLLSRGLSFDPLKNVIGDWSLYDFNAVKNTVVSTYGIQNILLFVPFSFLLLWFLNTRKNRKSIGRSLFRSCMYSFVFSLIIEFLQLILCLGTFQVSDVAYNTLGGIIGSLLYLTGWVIICIIKKALNKK